jgi:hypothetical protein
MKNSARGDSSTGSELKAVEEACHVNSPVVRKNPFMLREPQHERGAVIGHSST